MMDYIDRAWLSCGFLSNETVREVNNIEGCANSLVLLRAKADNTGQA